MTLVVLLHSFSMSIRTSNPDPVHVLKHNICRMETNICNQKFNQTTCMIKNYYYFFLKKRLNVRELNVKLRLNNERKALALFATKEVKDALERGSFISLVI